jgi:hypothetical protein
MADLKMYGLNWPNVTDPLMVERLFVKGKGYYTKGGKTYGHGLYHHMRQMMTYCWPEDDHHRWSDLGLKRICENEITVFLGSSDSNKTYLVSRFVLLDWWANSDNTLWLVSSTEMRGAELRIWGKLKELFNRARKLHPWLPGTVLDSKHAITTEEISEDGSEARLLTKGLIFIPCKTNNRWLGMGAYAGIKPTRGGRLGHCGDEVSFMERSFLDAYSNWYGKENFKGLLTGNPTDIEDPLCTAAEPVEGWDNWHDTEKTQEWRTKFYGAWAVAFDGRDSPNFDFPANEPTKFPYLIGRKKLEAVEKTEGRDSPLWWMMCVGKPLPGSSTMKVISRQMCEQNKAYEDVVWEGNKTTHVLGLDAAYGGIGGDRCVLFHSEFGTDVEGKSIFACRPPILVPVSVKNAELAETQIARFCMQYADGMGIPADNFFFDARATLAVELARIWSPQVNAVDFGGTATKRPVSQDEYVWEGDTQTKRLKRCDEHYSKFVTELWFSIRYAVMSHQIRRLPKDVAAEGAKRLWRFTKGQPPRIEVESKIEMKERTKESPDLFDSLATTMEGARRLGFVIENMKEPRSENQAEEDWLNAAVDKHKSFMRKHELVQT